MSENEKESIEIIGDVVEVKEVNEKAIEEAEKKMESKVDEDIVEISADSEAEINGINISEEVVATIASIAASEVNGVANMNGGFVGGLSEMFGKKTKGVKVQVGDKETIIDINLTIEYGARIPDIAWEVQNKVKTQVESMTVLKGVIVNIHVQGVSVSKKKQESTSNGQDSEK